MTENKMNKETYTEETETRQEAEQHQAKNSNYSDKQKKILHPCHKKSVLKKLKLYAENNVLRYIHVLFFV